MTEFNNELRKSVLEEVSLKINNDEYSFMKESFMREGAEVAINRLIFLFQDYFSLLWRLKGMKIHYGKSEESLHHILCEEIPRDAEERLSEVYKKLKLCRPSDVENYYGRLEEG